MEPDRDVAGRDRRTERPSAPDALVESVRALVDRYCRARLGGYPGGAEVAQDVTDEVCLSAVDALRGREDGGAPLAAVVFSIASHKVAEAERSLARPSTEGGATSTR